jgi:hypothetical protein
MDNPFNEYLLGTTDEVAQGLIQGTTTTLRSFGWSSIVLSLVWGWGFASLFGFGLGLIGVLERNRVTVRSGSRRRRAVARCAAGWRRVESVQAPADGAARCARRRARGCTP